MMHFDPQLVTLLVGLISGFVGYKANQINLTSAHEDSATKLADIYADHYPGLLTEIEELRKQLSQVISERDDLRQQVNELSQQVTRLQQLLNEFTAQMEEHNGGTKKDL